MMIGRFVRAVRDTEKKTLTGVKILTLYDDTLVSQQMRRAWTTAVMYRSHDKHGVYAYADMAVALREYRDSASLAEVVAYGEVQVHAYGWHADAAIITRIFLPQLDWYLRPRLLKRYGVPIEPLSRIKGKEARRMTGVKILALHGDMLYSPYLGWTQWTTARMERSHDYHGVYAYATMDIALGECRDRGAILADVESGGDVQVHDHGWHADAATITRIYLPLSDWHMRPALLARYGVPIEPLSRITGETASARGHSARSVARSALFYSRWPARLLRHDPLAAALLRSGQERHACAPLSPRAGRRMVRSSGPGRSVSGPGSQEEER